MGWPSGPTTRARPRYGDIREYLTTRIEAEVRKQKNEAPLTLGLPAAFTGQLESTGE